MHRRSVPAEYGQIGPLARAAFWECIVIPDIRLQCRGLAERIAAGQTGALTTSRVRCWLNDSGANDVIGAPGVLRRLA
jgi:hypothetical protein